MLILRLEVIARNLHWGEEHSTSKITLATCNEDKNDERSVYTGIGKIIQDQLLIEDF